MADEMKRYGYNLVTDGTDNHMFLMSTIDKGLTGSKVESAFDKVHITINKNTIVGDKSAMTPGGIRIGTPAVTTRGYDSKDMLEVAKFCHEGILIAKKVQEKHGKKLKDFNEGLNQSTDLAQLATEVGSFSKQFELPGCM